MSNRIEAELTAIEDAVKRLRGHSAPRDTSAPLEVALTLQKARRSRDDTFPPQLFSDPAWDLLLEAYVAAEQGNPLSQTGLIVSAKLASATGDRWIKKLEKMGLLTHRASPDRKRSHLYGLTDKGLEAMTRALARMA